MCQMGIKAQWVKPYTQTTIDSDLSQKLQNILNEEFNPEHPDAVWCSDITYIWTFEVFVYLTSVMDLYSRKIVSWVLSKTLEASHVVECIEKSKTNRHIKNPLMLWKISCSSTINFCRLTRNAEISDEIFSLFQLLFGQP